MLVLELVCAGLGAAAPTGSVAALGGSCCVHVLIVKPQGGGQGASLSRGGLSLDWFNSMVAAYTAVLTQEGACCVQCNLLMFSRDSRGVAVSERGC